MERDGYILLELRVPVGGTDATRVEALGPPIVALTLAHFDPGFVHLYGDSKFVCSTLNMVYRASDVVLYNCSQLFLDVLSAWKIRVRWIPRNENQRCDTLAKEAVFLPSVSIRSFADVSDSLKS